MLPTLDELGLPSALVRPLTARSVVASTLLGTEPPRLPVSFLVRTGELFGLAEGTVRTALSRMVSAGEVLAEGDGWYTLGDELRGRQRRQRAGRDAPTVAWSGRWQMVVITASGRPAAERAELRTVLVRRRLAELREGVWIRPDNLDRVAPIEHGCEEFLVEHRRALGSVPGASGTASPDGQALAATLWDLEGWSTTAQRLRRAMSVLLHRLDEGDTSSLAPGFVVAAAVLRHLVADPLLPTELRPAGWPGDALRADYDGYDLAYRGLLSTWSGRAEPAT